jgi:TonB family protein
MFRMTFPKALFISFLWHIICVFSVVIVISPASKGMEKFSKINFIGAILDSDTFDFYKKNNNLAYQKRPYAIEKLTQGANAPLAFDEKMPKPASAQPYINKPYVNSITEIIKEVKYPPADILPQIKIADAGYSPEIESEVATRQILFRPQTPVISRAFQASQTPAKGEKFQVKLRFLVSPQGNVIFIEKIKSCGYSDIDLAAIRYMKNWQFAPIGPDKPKKNQEGIMLLELKAQ